MSKFKKQF